jgi:CDP-glucose 4,6-dehydratase
LKVPFGSFYKGKKVLVTGDTGFKGSWLVCWLNQLGADVHGFGLVPNTTPSLYDVLSLKDRMDHRTLDIRDAGQVQNYINAIRPDVVFHLAAQSLVRLSWSIPLETLHTNVLGTANLLHAIGHAGYTVAKPCTVIVITSDKCYENQETNHSYGEEDRMGGADIYSMSKGATELLVSAWHRSFFSLNQDMAPSIVMASCRAGNVVGGGDWSLDRIVPDAVKALIANEPIRVRNPNSIRPWQHVLEPLSGYLQVGAFLNQHRTIKDSVNNVWNFGPGEKSERNVGELCNAIVQCWGSGEWQQIKETNAPHESRFLKLDIKKAANTLGWQPVWGLEKVVEKTIGWYRLAHQCNYDANTMFSASIDQIQQYTSEAASKPLRWAEGI